MRGTIRQVLLALALAVIGVNAVEEIYARHFAGFSCTTDTECEEMYGAGYDD